jgi:GT2 family glycosyltransferase
MSFMEDTFFVVVNWNGAGLLPACLDALHGQTVRAAIVVVDNGSVDSSRAVVAARPWAEWLPLGQNTGFAAGANVGIRRALLAGARFVALVNTDVVLAPDWLERLRADADHHRACGLWNGLLLFQDDPERVNSTGLVLDGLLRAKDRDFGLPLAALARADGPIAGVTGGAVLLRASALRATGLLDPAYFAYCEDADLSLRAARDGIGCRFVAGARALHGYARTAGAGSPLQRYLLARNHLRLAARHLPLPLALLLVPALAILRLLLAAPRELLRRRPAHAAAQARAVRDGIWLAGDALGVRLGLRPAVPRYPATAPAAGAPWSAR